MKYFIYITDAESFLKNSNYGLSISDSEGMEDYGWVLVRSVEVDFNQIDRIALTRQAVEEIDKREKEVRSEQELVLQGFEKRRSELLSIPHLEPVA